MQGHQVFRQTVSVHLCVDGLVSWKGPCLVPCFMSCVLHQHLTSSKNTLCSMRALQMKLSFNIFRKFDIIARYMMKTTQNCLHFRFTVMDDYGTRNLNWMMIKLNSCLSPPKELHHHPQYLLTSTVQSPSIHLLQNTTVQSPSIHLLQNQCYLKQIYFRVIGWSMIAYIELFSALLSRLTALACGSAWVTGFRISAFF